MKKLLFIILVLFLNSMSAQINKPQKEKENEEEQENFEYDIKHKSQKWFLDMQNGANYFAVKSAFDAFFKNHKNEKSKPRALGESWLKSKIFYLDNKGFVQAEPNLYLKPQLNSPLNQISATTQTTVGSWGILGPVNSASTNYSSKGNNGGYVYLNRMDPTNTQKMFVSFLTGGMWMTTNGGTNWTLTDSNLPDDKCLDLDVCISNPQRVYALMDSHVIKSIDGGLNWLPTTMTKSNYTGAPLDIAVSTTNPDVVVARWGTSLYRTTNGGTTWTAVVNNLPIHSIWDGSVASEMVDWSTTNPNVVYAISTSHNNQLVLRRSGDSGATFVVANTITLDPTANGQVVGWAKILQSVNNATSFYIAVGTGTSAYAHQAVQLYKINATTGVTENTRTNMIAGIGDAYAHDPLLHHGDICMDRTNENKIVFGSYGNQKIQVSEDNGSTFVVSTDATHFDLRSIDMIDSKIIVGSDGETAVTINNGLNFTNLTNSIGSHELWGFGSSFKANLVASGNNHGPVMIKETANGFDWYNGPGADQGNTDVNPLDNRYIYSQGYSNYRFFRTGVHTLENQSNFLDVGGIYAYFNSIEFHPNNYYSIITHHAGQYPTGNPNLATWKNSLIKTEDNGNSISIVKTFANQVFREKISMKNPKHIYVVEGLTNNKLWYSANSGTTWTNITPTAAASSNQFNISDIAVSDVNPNEVWVTYSGVQSVCKVLKTADFGATYTNLSQAILTTSPITKIVLQRGSNGGVYIGNKSGVFYRNNTMPNWVMLGNGLPMCEVRFMFINYNENKLKIGTSRGAFLHNLYEISPPSAQISVNSTKITCPSVETAKFKDYSVIRNASATWNWSFPGGTPSTSALENPEVSYANAANGFYDATLTITDAYGTSTQTLNNFIEINNQCGTAIPETIPGNVAKIAGNNNDFLKLEGLNVNQNSFTFSCWIKPNGIQPDYSAIFSAQNFPGTLALNFSNGNNTVGFHPNWSWSSGLQAPPNEWSHVAMVSNGTTVTIYVNGVASIRNTALPAAVFSNIDLGRYGNGFNGRSTNMDIDEVCIWNRPLTIDEIRKWRHLTKSDTASPISTGLMAYFQFNEMAGPLSINKTAQTNFIQYLGNSGAVHNASTAPVFGGISEKIDVSSSGLKNFATTGVSLNFANGTYPNGDVWVSTSTINPNALPDSLTNFNSYYTINNYGTNQSFTPLQSMSFTGNSNFLSSTPSQYNLFKRGINAFGTTWGAAIDQADDVQGSGGSGTSVTFSTGLSVASFGQFVISNATLLGTQNNEFDKKILLYPNPVKVGQQLTIELPADVTQKANVYVYDMLGKKVATLSLKDKTTKILLNLPAGVYNILIVDGKNTHTYKQIISQ